LGYYFFLQLLHTSGSLRLISKAALRINKRLILEADKIQKGGKRNHLIKQAQNPQPSESKTAPDTPTGNFLYKEIKTAPKRKREDTPPVESIQTNEVGTVVSEKENITIKEKQVEQKAKKQTKQQKKQKEE